MDLTAILTCKDREKNTSICLASINICNPIPRTILVDFGSLTSLKSYEKKYKWLKVIRVDRNTNLFHKTRALNIGIKQVKTKYTCLTDVDQTFQPNFFSIVYKELLKSSRNFIRCKTNFLPIIPKWFSKNKFNWQIYRNLLNFAKKNATKKPHGEGCCHGVKTSWLLKVNGLDEEYIGWGYEDNDLVLRAKYCGLEMVWINDKTSMIHFPHPRDKVYFSNTFWNKNKKRYMNKIKNCNPIVNINNKWGII